MENKIKTSFNLITIALILVIGGAAFFGGMKYQQSKTPQFNRGQFGQMGTANQNGNQKRIGNGQVMGEITSVDSKSITVKTNDGSSKIILLSDKTAINKATSGQISDLVVGTKVSVFGTANTDGSVSGTNIQLNPTVPEGVPSGTPQKTN